MEFTTCKKPEGQRFGEVREFIYEALINFLVHEDRIEKTCKEASRSRLAIGLIKSLDEGIYTLI